ncbi:NAD(P)-dependent oxidoreductase [Patulibacter sp.]|uniref:NAD-dependent epimerase/dehydratase family protein n=1 Tax=Patulibacter sp. TaxID=1912859 RepID=UPI0027166F27|nr:NAD-dependent epimerase/dehydratase family protein [Patulibacter sp.]MDO9408201.1 NAD-dependent epimerase/dehydratase family protein [Patulibacter sp.]
MRRVLVTGATGFVGRHALGALVSRGYEVHAVSSKGPTDDSPEGVVWHVADLLDPVAGPALVSEVAPTDLLHLAWYAEPGAFWGSPENLRWVAASLALLRAFADAGGTRAVLAGTCAEYAWENETHCVEGSTPLKPATLYGAAKHGLHVVAEAFAADAGISLAWGRIFFLFGPHEDSRRLVSSVARAVIGGKRAETSHGEQVRDFLYAPDLADAFAALLASEVTGAVNVASGEPVAIRDVVQAIGDSAGHPELLAIGARPTNSSEPAVLTADVFRLCDEVGWTPPATREDRVSTTVEWWLTTLGETA